MATIAWSLYFTVLILTINKINGNCYCDKEFQSVECAHKSLLIHSATIDNDLPTDSSACVMSNCISKGHFSGDINGKMAAWTVAVTKCDLSDGYMVIMDGPHQIGNFTNLDCPNIGYSYIGNTKTSELTVKFVQPPNSSNPIQVILFLQPHETSTVIPSNRRKRSHRCYRPSRWK